MMGRCLAGGAGRGLETETFLDDGFGDGHWGEFGEDGFGEHDIVDRAEDVVVFFEYKVEELFVVRKGEVVEDPLEDGGRGVEACEDEGAELVDGVLHVFSVQGSVFHGEEGDRFD